MFSKELEKKIESNRHFIEVLLIVVTLIASLHGPTDKTYGELANFLVIVFIVLSIIYYNAISRPKFYTDKLIAPVIVYLLSASLAGIIGITVGLSVASATVALLGGLGIVIILIITLVYFYVFYEFFAKILDTRSTTEQESELKKLSDQELIRFGDEHLWYEILMLNETTRTLNSHPPQLETNMALESFTIHLRALYGFLFYDKKNKSEDALAIDFFDRPEDWKTELKGHSKLRDKLKKMNERVGKEIVHLSYGRLEVTPSQKGWDPSITNEINSLLKIFISKIPSNRISPKTKQLLDRL